MITKKKRPSGKVIDGKQRSKQWKPEIKATLVVAVISLLGTTVGAFVANIDKWKQNSDVRHTSRSAKELADLLINRRSEIQKRMEEDEKSVLSLISSEKDAGARQRWIDLSPKLQDNREQIVKLMDEHVRAINEDQAVLAHELHPTILNLLAARLTMLQDVYHKQLMDGLDYSLLYCYDEESDSDS